MINNIYHQLGFEILRHPVYSNALIDHARDLFNTLPLKNTMLRQLIIKNIIFEETFAISTAEDSELTRQKARSIKLSPDVELRLKKYRESKNFTSREKYDQLQNENIAMVELNTVGLSFQELSIDHLLELHANLTVGLDEYAHDLGVSRYHPGELRKSNSTKVGKIRQYLPPDYKKIPFLLKSLFKEFSERKTIHLTDILEFHILLYAIHPFANGNKRVCRLIESLLLNHYGYSASRILSLSIFYGDKKEDYNLFLIESLRQKTVGPFVNFGLRGYFYAGTRLFNENSKKYIFEEYAHDFAAKLRAHLEQSKIKSAKIIQSYLKTPGVIMELEGIFTHQQFIAQMKHRGYSLGVSQEILKFLKQAGLLRHKGKLYFIDKAAEINEFSKKLTNFLIKNDIHLEE